MGLGNNICGMCLECDWYDIECRKYNGNLNLVQPNNAWIKLHFDWINITNMLEEVCIVYRVCKAQSVCNLQRLRTLPFNDYRDYKIILQSLKISTTHKATVTQTIQSII